MTREQENAVEALALTRGRLAVREGFADKHVHVVFPCGEARNIDVDGRSVSDGCDWSIDWTQ